jgi:hypothetical protein
MIENRMGLVEAAKLLREDKGALSAYLKDRAPSAYLIYRIQKVFEVTAHELMNDTPADPVLFRPGPPAVPPTHYRPRKEENPTPSGASREAAAPGKPKHHSGGGGL